jgi:tetratricopeptide (TPR) repeat protein
MKEDRILRKAKGLALSRRHGDAIRLLEPEVVRYRDSFSYYHILAVACLHSGDYGGALTYFRRAREIKMRNCDALLGLAVLHLRRGETDRAVEYYLEVQEIEPGNTIAKKALAAIRKHGEPESLSSWLETGKVSRLYPRLKRDSASVRIAVCSLSVIVCAAGIGSAALLKAGPFARDPGADRSGFAASALDAEDRAEPVETGGSYRYILTRKDVLAEYESARKLFLDYRDEAARTRVNRILDSNASAAIKRKARLLADYASAPGFDTLKDRFEYAEVLKDPYLYRDCHVLWRGMATNLTEKAESTSFQLLVGYDTRSTLQGIVPVAFASAVSVDVERPLEVLGRVVLVDGRVHLTGIALHQAAALK